MARGGLDRRFSTRPSADSSGVRVSRGMILSNVSNSVHSSTPPTSTKSSTPSNGQSQQAKSASTAAPQTTFYVIEAASPPAQRSTVELFASALPTVALSLFGIVAVHRLTRGREREKALFEQHKLLHEQAAS